MGEQLDHERDAELISSRALVDDAAFDDRRRSFEEVFLAEYQPMVRLAVLLVDDLAVAEELVQDAFVRLHQRWRRVDRPGAYLRTSVVNACRNELRRRKRERRARRAEVELDSVELGADEMFDALAQLHPKRRAAIVLRYYGGLSEREIADTLSVRPGTVKSLLSRGLRELRRTIGD
ncbi:MAG: sigma-70 family RNA polymerase sigma factor [Actinomycetota bacterium]